MGYFQEIYLDINPNNLPTIVIAKQYDADYEGITAYIIKNGQVYTITGNKILFRVRKSDGYVVTNDAVINDDQSITITFNEQLLLVKGRAYADLAEIDEDTGQILSTTPFIIDIKVSPDLD